MDTHWNDNCVAARRLRRSGRIFNRRRLRRSSQRILTLLLTATTTLANCLVYADDRPCFLSLPGCAERCSVCPSTAAAHSVRMPYQPAPDESMVNDPTTAPPWHLTIHEAVQIALSNSQVVRNLGLQRAQASDIDEIRAVITTYDPLAAAATADAQWGIFDPLWTTSMDWDHRDLPPGTSFSGGGPTPPRLDTAVFDSGISQLLPSGGQIRAEYVTQYLLNPDHPIGLVPNPQYFSYSQFGVDQPLCQGLGVNVTMAPIRIAAAQAEQTDWRFKQEVLALVRSVETSFWALYAQEQNLKVIDEVLPMFGETVRIRQQQSQANAGTESEVAQARSDLLLYQQQRLDVLSMIAEQQLVIRNLLGLALDDNRYMALVAVPAKTPPLEPLGAAVATAIDRRPDVLRQRLAVYVAQQQTVIARDQLRPRLDFNAFWRINGLGEDVGDSVDSVSDDKFTDWHMGFAFQVPLGRRQAKGNLRAAQLTIEREQAFLEQTAHQASYEVADAYRRATWLSQQQQVADDRIAALGQWNTGAKAQFDNPPAGMSTILALQLYLQNLRDTIDATEKSNAIMADFNSALARLEEVKGTLLESELVQVAGDGTDQLPEGLPSPKIQVPDSMMPQVPENATPSPPSTPPTPPSLPSPPAGSDGGASSDPANNLPAAPMSVAVAPSSPVRLPEITPTTPAPTAPAPVAAAPAAVAKTGDPTPTRPSPIATVPTAPIRTPESTIAPPAPIAASPAETRVQSETTAAPPTPTASVPIASAPNDTLKVPESVMPSQPPTGVATQAPSYAPPSQATIARAPETAIRLPESMKPSPTPVADISRATVAHPDSTLPTQPPVADFNTSIRVPDSMLPGPKEYPSAALEAPSAPIVAAIGPAPVANDANGSLQVPDSMLPSSAAAVSPPAQSGRWYSRGPSAAVALAGKVGIRVPDSMMPGPKEVATAPATIEPQRVADAPSRSPAQAAAPIGSIRVPDSMMPGPKDVAMAPAAIEPQRVAYAPSYGPSQAAEPIGSIRVPDSMMPGPKEVATAPATIEYQSVANVPSHAPAQAAEPIGSIRVPDSIMPQSAGATTNFAARLPATNAATPTTTQVAAAPYSPMRLPDSMLPSPSTNGPSAPAQTNGGPSDAWPSDALRPAEPMRMPESMLPESAATAARTSWQSTIVR
jgi:outer membrane protein TolC